MLTLLRRMLKRLWPRAPERPVAVPLPEPRAIARREPRRVTIRRYSAPGDAPPLHWSACHPATAARFKAELICPNGHGLTLRSHRIDAAGTVSPSVVCPARGCLFHEFVKLDDWTFGPLPKP